MTPCGAADMEEEKSTKSEKQPSKAEAETVHVGSNQQERTDFRSDRLKSENSSFGLHCLCPCAAGKKRKE
ncbi:hypothetical protein RRG08_043699 [Elysia crispata]|uniref:Uncharacterized protein n=1 Tax=Elysia crispata TaxID=231223 RepID=A0AAE1DIZ6_9GAST|nr:hypothetical protein RRG08_043699 [Elysia crispata]